MTKEQEKQLALYDDTGALLMLNKDERKLLKELLLISLKSKASRDWIEERLGSNYIEIGEHLLKTMGGR